MDAETGRTQRIAVGHMNLHTAADLPGVFGKRRGEPSWTNGVPRQFKFFQLSSKAKRIKPGRANVLKWTRRPASFGQVRPFDKTGSGIKRDRVERGQVRRRLNPRETGLVE